MLLGRWSESTISTPLPAAQLSLAVIASICIRWCGLAAEFLMDDKVVWNLVFYSIWNNFYLIIMSYKEKNRKL